MIRPLLLFTVAILPCNAYFRNATSSRFLIEDLLRDYDVDVRPFGEVDNVTTVELQIYLKSIQDFDEVKQTFVISAGFTLRWNDSVMTWDPYDYDGILKIQISQDRVWTPEFILATTSKDTYTYGRPWQKVVFYWDGLAFWMTAGLVQSTCDVNVKRYPFDTQECVAQFVLWGYDIYEVDFVLAKPYVNLIQYTGSGSWDLVSTSISKGVLEIVEWPQVDVTFHLRRKPNFVIINVLGPLLILDFLNLMAFFLVLESGERVSYCLTVLLAITVFLSIISDTLPNNSESMPIISYKLMTDLVISALITVATIFNLGLYHRSQDKAIPKWLRRLFLTLNLFKHNRNKPGCRFKVKRIKVTQQVAPNKLSQPDVKPDIKTDVIPMKQSLKKSPDVEKPVTWQDISNMMDFLFFITFMFAFVLSFLSFILAVVP